MSWVKARPGEDIDSLLKRFKKAVDDAGVLADFRKHEFYEKPSVKRKRKQAAARKRAMKRARKQSKHGKKSRVSFKFNKDRTEKIPMPPPGRNKDNKFEKKIKIPSETSKKGR